MGGGLATYTNPSTILLPAGLITISTGWALPSMTKLIGVGTPDPGDAAGIRETTIKAASSGFSGTALLSMGGDGTGTAGASGVGISNLILVGSTTQVIDGIRNFNAAENSFVEHVNMYRIGGVGLNLGTIQGGVATSNHSGPYSDIWFESSGAGVAETACVKILNAEPRAIRDITCANASSTAIEAAIYLDGQNVSLQDIHIEGFTDGIVVGADGNSASNVVSNVTGVNGSNGSMTNVVHICGAGATTGACTGGGWSVTDLSLQAISSFAATASIQDDVTTTTLLDATVGMYVLGQAASSGHSRFSSSLNAPTWIVGSTGVGGTYCNSNGSLYSNTSGSPSTLYVCVGHLWTGLTIQ
jgi:hypothetical protein